MSEHKCETCGLDGLDQCPHPELSNIVSLRNGFCDHYQPKPAELMPLKVPATRDMANQRDADQKWHEDKLADEKRKIYKEEADWLEWFRDNASVNQQDCKYLSNHIADLKAKAGE